eukprot:TRINITY_DN40872_c0_g1_i1.p1 TRINITY_DN40872_c0_g1~~TRINITY_DN40872_c0_g1_i1.p1  ORF type:complete len:441 (+),score=100.45 TRINITY_DN40872_c0_g1_i1:166-1488(+)
MWKGLPVPFDTCKKLTAAAIVLLVVSSTILWAGHGAQEAEQTPISFLQMESSFRRSSLIQKQVSSSCPRKLLQLYPDCSVVSVRVDFKVGEHHVKNTDSGALNMVYSVVDPAMLPSAGLSVIGWKDAIPEVKSTCSGEEGKSVDLVHHVNIYAHTSDLPLKVGRFYTLEDEEAQSVEATKNRMVASHDKGAGEYMMPFGFGISVDDPMYMEHHLLFPHCWNFGKEIPMRSGMDLYVTSKASMKPAALVGALNFGMDVMPGQGSVDYVTRLDSSKLNAIFAGGRKEAPLLLDTEPPEILAIHLHTHDIAKEKFFEVLNPDGSVQFRSDKEKAGYGLKEQSFFNLDEIGWPRLQLQPGQQIRQHCTFQTDNLHERVIYGLDWGQEMCAPLMVVGGAGLRDHHHGLDYSLLSEDDGFLVSLQDVGRFLQSMARDVVQDIRRLI